MLRPSRRRRSWVRGGSTTTRWDGSLLGLALAGLGLAVAGTAVVRLEVAPSAAAAATALVLWSLLLVPVVVAYRRSVPRGLFGFRAIDLLYGLIAGVLLRLTQGLVETWVTGSTPPVPSYPTLSGELPVGTWVSDGLLDVLVGPVVEEVFFHGVVLVAIHVLARRRWGPGVAAPLAVTGSALPFVLAHVLLAPAAVDHILSLALVGVVCGSVVVLTGRLWGAIFIHIVYNATFLALAIVGTVLA